MFFPRLTKPEEYPAVLYLFFVLLYRKCFQTETQLAENNPLQHYYLPPAVRAAMSFSMIVYQAAYLCWHDNSVNNHRVLSFRPRCEIDSVTYAVSTVISMETERSCGSEEFLLTPLKDITSQRGVSNSSAGCCDPVPPSCPPCWEGEFTAALLLKLRGGEKKKPLPEINAAARRAFTMAL